MEKRDYMLKLNLNRGSHAEIIKKLESVPNRTEYLRKLIRRDMNADKGAEKGAGKI